MKPTEEQLRLRALVERMKKEEMPLSVADHAKLSPFIQVVREEIVEEPKRISRTFYYMLNERGLKLLHDWDRGALDKYL